MGNNKTNELDIYLFHEGKHKRVYEYMGMHFVEDKKAVFRTWAPNAKSIQVIGDFNGWNGREYRMNKINNEGIWEITIEGVYKYSRYKFRIEGADGKIFDKADPYAFYSQQRPHTASVAYGCKFNHVWNDCQWIENRVETLDKPLNIYEVHLGSWKRGPENSFMNYREIAHHLSEYIKEMGYTHVEIMPVHEYPVDESWGYQPSGYYSVTSRYGTPEDFMYFVDVMHQNNIGVILDWVASHFAKEPHGLYKFDGAPTYEYDKELLAENYEWGTMNFNLGKNEVCSFLISNALFWLREFHIDGLRVDAVANMLYLDYGKRGHPELKNIHGNNENLDSVEFLRQLNKAVKEEFPVALICAEESTAWPKVTGKEIQRGLGFSYKWNMGWMNDILEYMKIDPLWKKTAHDRLTFSFNYAFSENYILPFSHDEVVHGKGSLINKMPGKDWDKFANLRVLLGYMMAHPGKKLNFMGNGFAQHLEWRFYEQLEWKALQMESNKKFNLMIKDINRFYLKEKSLWELDSSCKGFQWLDSRHDENILIFVRRSFDIDDYLVVVVNFSGRYRERYKVPVPKEGRYEEAFSTNNLRYGGTGLLNTGELMVDKGHLEIDLPSFSVLFFKPILR